MMRIAALALLLVLALLGPGMAQTTNSTSGGIDSATSRNGYPAGGGTVSLPTVQNSSASATGLATTTAAGTTTSATTGTTTTGTTTTGTGGAAGATSGGAGAGGSTGGTGGGGRGAGGASTGGATSSRASGTQGGGHFVLCPPSGGGLAPLFTGMDLSCAPD
jgi:hypothetical protein